jgi:hypothetical protein
MMDKATPAQRKQLDDAIAQRWRAIRDGGDLESVRKFVAVFGTTFPVGRDAQLQLAERLMATGSPDDLTDAETKLQALCFSPDLRKQDPATAARAVDAMIRIYLKRGLYEDAVGFYKQLGTEFAGVPVRDGKTGAELLAELFTDKRFLPYLEPQGLSWRGAVNAKDTPGSFPNTQATTLTVEPEGDLLPFFRRHRLVLDINLQGGNAWQLRLLDRATNEERWKQGGLPAAHYFINNPTNLRYAYATGHTLVLHLNHLVLAYNLAERRELWRYNLYGKNQLLFGNAQSAVSIDPADGRVNVMYQDGRQEKLGGVGLVEPGYVVLHTRDGLVAVDPHRPGPSVLWTKADVSMRAQVFGDDQHVYVVESGAPARALRAADGVAEPVPDFARLYATPRARTLGRCLLLAEDDPAGGKALRLYDVRAGRDVWRQKFAAGAKVIQSEDPGVTGVVEPDHAATLLDALTGRVLFKTPLQPEHTDKLAGAALVADGDRYYLALSRPPEDRVSWNPSVGFGLRSLRVNGPLYALSRAGGAVEWVCDFLPHQTLLLEQVRDLPLLLFAAQYNKTAANGGYERQAVRVTGVDKRTGKLTYDKEFGGQHNPFHALRTDPQAGVIELIRQDLKITFRVEDAQSARAGGTTAAVASR